MRKKKFIGIMLTLLLAAACTGCGRQFLGFLFGEANTMPQYTENSSAGDPSSGTQESEDDTSGDPSSDAQESEDDTSGDPSSDAQESGNDTSGDLSSGAQESETTSSERTDDPSEPSSPYLFANCDETVYTTDHLNIRTAPSTDAEVLILLAPGKSLKRTGYHEEWSRLEYNGQTAYAASQYLTTAVPALSNEIMNYGYDRVNRADNNVPGLIAWYTRNWGTYADFVQDTSSKVIYLTMDEGYESGNTPRILDILKEKNVKSVFFLTKGFVDSHPELVQRMIDEGHILGNHTCAHPAAGMPSLSVEEQKADIMTLHQMVLDQFAYDMKLFRYPAGIFSEQSLDLVTSLGYRSVFWSFAYRDFDLTNQPDPAAALKQCLDELHPGAIYLLHAVSDTNTEILGDWIDGVRAMGYEFGVYPTN